MTLPTFPTPPLSLPPPDALDRARAAWRSEEMLALQGHAAEVILRGELAYSMPAADGGAAEAGYAVEDGVAVVSIAGALMSVGGWYWDGYESIAKRVEHAHANAQVRAVMLAISSPGGMVAGMLDGMRALRAAKARSGKRTVAWVASGAYSAAYGLGSTCDEIVLDELAGVGSIGVIDALCSRVEEARKVGVDVRVIASGVEKTDGHPFVEITEDAEARKRERVMAQAQAFAREIHAGRPALTAEAALALHGGVRFGRAAVADGLADRISTRAVLLVELAATRPPTSTPPSGPRGSASPETPTRTITTMDDKQLAALTSLLAAKTGETDPDRQLGALTATFDQAARTAAAEAQLKALQEKLEKTERDAETAARASAFEAALKAGQEEGKLTPAEAEGWRADFAAGSTSLGVLEGNLKRRTSIPALSQEHRDLRPPAAPVVPGASARVSALVQKGYAALSWDERNDLASADPTTHGRLFEAWVKDGRPQG